MVLLLIKTKKSMHRVQANGIEPKFTCTMRWIFIVIHAAWRLCSVVFLTPKKMAR